MIGHQLGATVMMQLGAYQFAISRAAYQELTRRSDYRWPEQERFGQIPALQYTGRASESMTLSGVIYPEYRGGLEQLNGMRSMAAAGRPLQLISGAGVMLGEWVIESIEERQSVFAAQGLPRRQDFTMALRKFADAPQATAVTVAGSSGESAGGIAGFIERAASAAASAVAAMNSALETIQSTTAAIGNATGSVIATVQRGLRTAKDMRDAVEEVRYTLSHIDSPENLQAAMYSISAAAGAASRAGTFAADSARALAFEITPRFPSSTVRQVTQCEALCGKAAVSATSVHAGANQMAAGG